VTIRKMIENAARMMVRAISLGFSASTHPRPVRSSDREALTRARRYLDNDPVGQEPVCPRLLRIDRPPASRITGALSPVIADSSTEATPSTISPSAGITSPASTRTRSPCLSSVDATSFAFAGRIDTPRNRILARGTQALRLGLAACLGKGLGEVREENCQEQQDRQRCLVNDYTNGRMVVNGLERDQRGQHPAHFDQKHDRVLGHVPGIEHHQ